MSRQVTNKLYSIDKELVLNPMVSKVKVNREYLLTDAVAAELNTYINFEPFRVYNDAYDPTDENASAHSILVVSEHGYGKRTDFDEYRKTNRGGKGVKTLNITEKTGSLVAIKNVTDENDLMIINRSGLTIRMAVSGIKVAGRATQGVRLINIKEGDSIAAISAELALRISTI